MELVEGIYRCPQPRKRILSASPESRTTSRNRTTSPDRNDPSTRYDSIAYDSRTDRRTKPKDGWSTVLRTPAYRLGSAREARRPRSTNSSVETKEAKAVALIATKKLEDYLNFKRREECFSVTGATTTTKRMEPLDTSYRLLERIKLDYNGSRSPRNYNRGSSSTYNVIHPNVQNNSRLVVQYSELERLENNANVIYMTHPIVHLMSIHDLSLIKALDHRKATRCPGYTTHMGASLHQHELENFYRRHGMRVSCVQEKKGDSQSVTSSNNA